MLAVPPCAMVEPVAEEGSIDDPPIRNCSLLERSEQLSIVVLNCAMLESVASVLDEHQAVSGKSLAVAPQRTRIDAANPADHVDLPMVVTEEYEGRIGDCE